MKNAPLVEIIAEVRWGPGLTTQPQSFHLGGLDAFGVKLGIALGKQGYDRIERVLPEGVPAPSGAIVYRYRRGDDQQNTLFQVGVGVFTANGLPPYNSWREFEPVIVDGLNSLWPIKPFRENEPIELVLRYVDAFERRHIGDLPTKDFLERVIGVTYSVPAAIAKLGKITGTPSMRFNAIHESESGDRMHIDVGEALKDGAKAILMNSIAQSKPAEFNSQEDVIKEFRRLQLFLHEIFDELTGRDVEVRKQLQGDQ